MYCSTITSYPSSSLFVRSDRCVIYRPPLNCSLTKRCTLIRYESDSKRPFTAFNVNTSALSREMHSKLNRLDNKLNVRAKVYEHFCSVKWQKSITKRHGNRVCVVTNVIRESGRWFLLFFPTMRSRQNPPIANRCWPPAGDITLDHLAPKTSDDLKNQLCEKRPKSVRNKSLIVFVVSIIVSLSAELYIFTARIYIELQDALFDHKYKNILTN